MAKDPLGRGEEDQKMRRMILTLATAGIVLLTLVGSRVDVVPVCLAGPQTPALRLQPDPAGPRQLPAELLARLRKDPYTYFRFINKAWARRVCAAFRRDLPALTRVRLHGDAHLMQYAFTAEAHGLDDFDDTAEGPSVIDSVRFLGSLDLAARQRGWVADLNALFDEFFRGYRTALKDPGYVSATPGIVRRLRPKTARSQKEFLEWAESLMEPVGEQAVREMQDSLALLAALVDSARPGLERGYFTLKKVGQLRLGIGSVLTPKLLIRVEGASSAEEDDVVLEGKQLSDLAGVECLDVPKAGEIFRVIGGAEQIGRIRHEVLSVIPKRQADRPETRDWWIRNWDSTYGEVDIDDLASVEELKEVAHDVGAQLGSANLRERSPLLEAQMRQRELETSKRLEGRIRLLARQLARELLEEWTRFRARSEAER
jgi:Uncharacterized protein conserved in bacteria (DUF2252)